MGGEWAEESLGDVIDIKHGFAFKGEFFRDEPPGDVLLTPGNFGIGGGFKADKFKYYDGPVPDEFVLREGDLLVTMTDLSKQADTLGYPAFVHPPRNAGPRYLHNQRLGRIIIKDKTSLDVRYLHYLMCSREYRHEVLASATGTTVKHTSPERIKRFRFLLPPLPEQRAIAHILGTLDDKIELNRRMNETLEAMARALFQSWFVDFDPVRVKAEGRDPGLPRETAGLFPDRFKESELGEIPAGWRVGSLEDIASVTMGLSPDGASYNLEGFGTPLINGPVEFGDHFPAKTKWTTSPTRLAEVGDLILCVRGSTTGRRVVADGSYCLGRGVCAIRAKSGARTFLYQAMNTSLDRLLSKTTGSVFPNLSAPDIKGFQILVPSQELIQAFDCIADPLTERAEANVRESRTLAALRDTLLPKLISGEVRLSTLRRMERKG